MNASNKTEAFIYAYSSDHLEIKRRVSVKLLNSVLWTGNCNCRLPSTENMALAKKL